MRYQTYTTLQQRREEVLQIKERFPDRIPLIAEPLGDDCPLARLTKCKFLIPADYHVSTFLTLLRKKLSVSPERSLYVFVGDNVLPQTSETFAELYSRHHNKEDGFLYLLYEQESTFGS